MLKDIKKMFKEAVEEVQEELQDHVAHKIALRTDIVNYTDHYTVQCEVPGLSREDIKIEIDENELTIEAKLPEPITDVAYHVKERAFGAVKREWKLPHVADDAEITAKIEDGILTIEIPKIEHTAKRVIDIAE